MHFTGTGVTFGGAFSLVAPTLNINNGQATNAVFSSTVTGAGGTTLTTYSTTTFAGNVSVGTLTGGFNSSDPITIGPSATTITTVTGNMTFNGQVLFTTVGTTVLTSASQLIFNQNSGSSVNTNVTPTAAGNIMTAGSQGVIGFLGVSRPVGNLTISTTAGVITMWNVNGSTIATVGASGAVHVATTSTSTNPISFCPGFTCNLRSTGTQTYIVPSGKTFAQTGLLTAVVAGASNIIYG